MPQSSTVHATANDALRGVLADVVDARALGGAADERLRQGTREQLNYGFKLTSATDRLTEGLKLHIAAARFVWMMAANNRLADIAFYEPLVANFTDDLLTVPGSSYGMRLRQPQPGLDQVAGVIGRLREDPNSRRAAVAIYQPVDAVRESKDIPCAFGMMFHVRDGSLSATIIMRSNNAWSLLPFNVFEFTMLAEVVAAELGLTVGEIAYFAGSMHVYDRDLDKARGLLLQAPAVSEPMPAMPRDVSPLVEITKLGQFEADLRHASAGIDARSASEWIDRLVNGLHPYWAQIGLLLMSAVAAGRDQDTLDQVRARLDRRYQRLVPSTAKLSSSDPSSAAQAGPLFAGAASAEVVTLPRSDLGKRFARLAEERETKSGAIPVAQLLRAQAIVFDRLAARGETEPLSQEVFNEAMNRAASSEA